MDAAPGQSPVAQLSHAHPSFTHQALAQARTFLFVPGSRPERFAKALGSGADAVVVDLEDAVASADKPTARQAIAQAATELRAAAIPVAVRINSVGSDAGREDLRWWAATPALAGLAMMVPKAESADDLHAAAQAIRVLQAVGPSASPPDYPPALLPLIESAAGWRALAEVAGAPGVVRLVLGHLDFQADTGLRCGTEERELDPLRFEIAMQTRLHHLAPAVDGVTTAIEDEARLREDTLRALRFGFGGKLCIHPRQVATVHAALAPSEAERAWAERVVAADEASGGAAVQLDGRMVDLPVVLQARRLLSRASAPDAVPKDR